MSAPRPFTCILWDVDGTIIDASEGILRRLTRCLADYGLPAPTRAELPLWIGPPMHESFQKNVGMTAEQATEAVDHYRAIGRADGYTTGARVYPGVADLIHVVREAGIPQSTASSKPEIQVIALLDHFQLSADFTAIVGATPDETTRASKADVVAEALRQLTAAGVDISRPVLIGDRHHDVEGAAVHNVPVIFAEWGFGSPAEADGTIASVADTTALRALLLPEG